MNTVLEEVTAEKISADHVRKRVKDWQGRIAGLYQDVRSWLPARMSATESRTRPMAEELMRVSKVAAVNLPVLDIAEGQNHVATLEPRALWVIGANGRLDLVTSGGHYIITDAAKNFASPRWVMAPLADRASRKRFTKTALLAVLKG